MKNEVKQKWNIKLDYEAKNANTYMLVKEWAANLALSFLVISLKRET